MNFRRHAKPEVFGFQIAPMVDIFLVLLIFFIVTWNFAINENALDLQLPKAKNAKPSPQFVNQVVINVEADGTVVMNRKPISATDLQSRLSKLSKLYPDQAVILRGDKRTSYNNIMKVMDIFRAANIWNVNFNTATAPQ